VKTLGAVSRAELELKSEIFEFTQILCHRNRFEMMSGNVAQASDLPTRMPGTPQALR
jgi:hypothetical protein